jgi:hypothetical protein
LITTGGSRDVVFEKNDESAMDRKKTIEDILKQVNEKRKTIKELRQKQSRFIGSFLEKES